MRPNDRRRLLSKFGFAPVTISAWVSPVPVERNLFRSQVYAEEQR
jgi:hypothetical protein